MSPAEFKKRLCRPVKFKGQGPPYGYLYGSKKSSQQQVAIPTPIPRYTQVSLELLSMNILFNTHMETFCYKWQCTCHMGKLMKDIGVYRL